MYQLEFYDGRAYRVARHKLKSFEPPTGFIDLADIELIRSSYWAEHCLECGEPQCYVTCPHFVERADGRCKRFAYGIRDNKRFARFPYHYQLAFRQWGKLETKVYPGVMEPQEALDLCGEWAQRCKQKRRLMGLGAFGLRKYPIDERQEFDALKYRESNKAGTRDMLATPDFLLQMYSCEKEPFTLVFDITDDTTLVYHRGVELAPGFNQVLLDVHEVFPGKGQLRAKIYPVNNLEVDIVLLFCEFVKLRQGVREQWMRAHQDEPKTTLPGEVSTEHVPATKVKCVAWDLDNTVWDGVLMESDPQSLVLREGVCATMEWLDQRGIIQIVVSKNDEGEVVPVLERLGIDGLFVARFIGWRPKSQSIVDASKLLNLGLDSFALIDDSAYERGEVAEALPMVRVYDERVFGLHGEGLASLSEFDVPVTADGSQRRELYQVEMRRKKASEASEGTDNLSFLRSCQLEGHVSEILDDEMLLRAYELLQRTNQLNLSGSKYEFEAFKEHVRAHQSDCLVMSCADRFGSYGQVLYLEAQVDSATHTLVIDEYALSCRVAYKCLEPALAQYLLDRYQGEGVTSIELRGKRTERNTLLRESFAAAGFEDHSGGEGILLVLPDASWLKNADVVTVG